MGGYKDTSQVPMVAASMGEVMACLIRVPVEVVKQRRQASASGNSLDIVRQTLKTEGVKGLYRGYLTTVAREIPFSLIQFPLWELLKRKVSDVKGSPTKPWEASLCGSIAGSQDAKLNTFSMLLMVAREKGVAGLFAGVTPRVTWISIGGAVFFGVYEKSKSLLADRI